MQTIYLDARMVPAHLRGTYTGSKLVLPNQSQSQSMPDYEAAGLAISTTPSIWQPAGKLKCPDNGKLHGVIAGNIR
jgi:hypothetical protein